MADCPFAKEKKRSPSSPSAATSRASRRRSPWRTTTPSPYAAHDSAIDVFHHGLGIAKACRRAPGEDALDARELFGGEAHFARLRILFEVLPPLGARDGHDVFSLGEHPRERELTCRDALRRGERLDVGDEGHVVGEIRPLKTRRRAAVVVVASEIFRALDFAGEKATTERAIRHKSDAELAADAEHVVLGIARPDFHLQNYILYL